MNDNTDRMTKVHADECTGTQEEMNRLADGMMEMFFQKSRNKSANFHDISIPWATPGVLQAIAARGKKWTPLHRMFHRMKSGCRFDFWRTLFENRNQVPREELLQAWYDGLNDTGRKTYQAIPTGNGTEIFTSKITNTEKLAASPVTNPLLIDDPIVSYRYCQARKPGWKTLQYIHGRRHNTLKLNELVRLAIYEDDLPTFAMSLDISGTKLSFSMLAEIIEFGAVDVFRYLMENRMVSDDIIPLRELCIYLATRFSDRVSVPMLAVIDEVCPGAIRNTTDDFGRNLLWYAIQNMRTGWFHPDCKLTPFLLEHGCDPQNNNQVGLTWQEVTDGLSLKQKTRMMQRRFNVEDHFSRSPTLKNEQGIERLEQPQDNTQKTA